MLLVQFLNSFEGCASQEIESDISRVLSCSRRIFFALVKCTGYKLFLVIQCIMGMKLKVAETIEQFYIN